MSNEKIQGNGFAGVDESVVKVIGELMKLEVKNFYAANVKESAIVFVDCLAELSYDDISEADKKAISLILRAVSDEIERFDN